MERESIKMYIKEIKRNTWCALKDVMEVTGYTENECFAFFDTRKRGRGHQVYYQ